jgi:hypothetical protein
MKKMNAHNAWLLLSCTGLLWMMGILSAAGFDEPKGLDQPVETAARSVPAEASASTKTTEPDKSGTAPAPTEEKVPRVPVSVARDRARLMHSIYSTTLGVMHDRYFHVDRSIVPARAMEDVFAEIEKETGSKANWISVNLKAMSINHEPSTEFEKRAAKEIATGEPEVETTEDGYYRRATAIPMTGGCISCHAGVFSQPAKNRKFAALVISIPVAEEPSVQ